jgi:hypothetical protein
LFARRLYVRVMAPAVAGVDAHEDLALAKYLGPLAQRIQVVESDLNTVLECEHILESRREIGSEQDLRPLERRECAQDVLELSLRHTVETHAGGGYAFQYF